MEYQRAELKHRVKQSLRQTRPHPMLVTLLFMVIVGVGSWLIQTVLGGLIGTGSIASQFIYLIQMGYEPEEALQSVMIQMLTNGAALAGLVLGGILVGVIGYLWQSLTNVGYEGYCLSMVRNQNPPLKRMFCGFPRIGGVLLTRILTGIFVFLWTLLFTVGLVIVIIIGALLMDAAAVLGVLLMIAGYVAWLVAVLWATLRYALADYALLDLGVSGLEAIRISKQLMKGNVRRLFVLQLSFIGWYLLQFAIAFVGILILGLTVGLQAMSIFAGGAGMSVGAIAGMLGVAVVIVIIVAAAELVFSLWLTPYISGSVAAFYDVMKSQRPEVAGESAGPNVSHGPYDGGSYTWSDVPHPVDPEPAAPLAPPAEPEEKPGEQQEGGEEQGPDDAPKPPTGPNYPEY